MNPDIIITDEINLDNDLDIIETALTSGVKVIATIHAKDLSQLRRNKAFEWVLGNKFFSRFVVLQDDEGPGTLTHIYDEKLSCIYCR